MLQACKPAFDLQIAVEADALGEKEMRDLLHLTQGVLNELNDLPAHTLHVRPAADTPKDSRALTVRLVPGTTLTTTLSPHHPILEVTYPSSTPDTPALSAYIANALHSAFEEEQSVLTYLVSSTPVAQDSTNKTLSPETLASLEKRTTRAFRYAETYHLTFSLFTAGAAPSTWAVDEAVEAYVRPVLDLLSSVHSFTVDTQVQLYAAPGVQSEVLTRDDLASFINAAEWPLSPSIGGAPTINFVLYVGNQSVAVSEGETSQSWLIPQWGAVYVLPHPPTPHLPAEDLKVPLQAFSSHLLSLLGTPETGSLPLRLSTLARTRTADLVLRASSTLGALARLSHNLPSISIPPPVADGVARSLSHLDQACIDMASPKALRHARTAEAEAERAFFEKSMVGQLYFPDEHKVAVYLPLLGPVGVPLVMGLLRELKGWLKRRREEREKKEA